jgi:hypothetical protein
MCWNEMMVLQIDPDNTSSKYKASAHMSVVGLPINHPSFAVSPVWTPIFTAQFKEL